MPDRKVGKIEARLTRVARSHRHRKPERAKGDAAEVETVPVPFAAGSSENIRRTVTYMWSAIEAGKLFVPPKVITDLPDCSTVAAVNASQSIYGFVFCLRSGVRKPEKSRTSCFLKNQSHSERKPPP